MTDEVKVPEGLPLKELPFDNCVASKSSEFGIRVTDNQWRPYIIHACNTHPTLAAENARKDKALLRIKVIAGIAQRIATGETYSEEPRTSIASLMDDALTVIRQALAAQGVKATAASPFLPDNTRLRIEVDPDKFLKKERGDGE